jgi:sortase A
MTDRGTTRLRARALLRFVGAVLATTGALLLAEVAATLLWQEPISALVAARGQNKLESQLATVSRRFARAADSPAAGRRRPRFEPAPAARAFAAMLRKGRAFGRIEMPTLERSFFVAEGTDTATLRKSPGHYPSTAMPGQGRTVAVAGHRTTYGAPFADLDELRRGERIMVTMPYGRFTYRVDERRIVELTEWRVTRSAGHERLVLTTCHPPFSAAKRLVVFARLSRSDGR